MSGVRIEVCVDSLASLRAAINGGADRIELCCALEVGGLTPSTGLLLAAAQSSVPVHAMMRPRGGDFVFAPAELDQMTDDVIACREAGLAGVVIGASHGGALDGAALSLLARAAGPLSLTLHRVFDLLEDPAAAIELAIDLGIDRILTSGGATAAEAGIAAIRRHVDQADGRLAIMVGGGIHAGNVDLIVRQTGVTDSHGSFSRLVRRYPQPVRQFGFAATDALAQTDARAVKAVRGVLEAI